MCDHRIAVDDEVSRFVINEVAMGLDCACTPTPSPPKRFATWVWCTRVQAPALRVIAELSNPQDEALADGMTSESSRHAHRRFWKQLKNTEAPW